jgi:hypothetical protein
MMSFWMFPRRSISWLTRAATFEPRALMIPVALITSARSCINLSSAGVNFESQNGSLILIQSWLSFWKSIINIVSSNYFVALRNY